LINPHIHTMTAVFYLLWSGNAAFRWQVGMSDFWCLPLERPVTPRRRICAVTRGFKTTTRDFSVFPFLPRHYHM